LGTRNSSGLWSEYQHNKRATQAAKQQTNQDILRFLKKE
jgi:hypothetical protein